MITKKALLEKDFKSVLTNCKDKDLYLPITIPFKDDNQSEEINHDSSILSDLISKSDKINDFFLFQFPRILPIKSSIDKAIVENENMKEEPSYDSHGFLIKPDFENHFKDFPMNSKIGKLRIYKSGKVRMQIGEVIFKLDIGVATNFAQELSVISKESKEAFFIGKTKENSFIVTPEI